MAEVKIEQGEAQGIKLFGKTIVFDVKVEDHTTKSAHHSNNDDHNNNNHNNNNNKNVSTSSEESCLDRKRPDKIVACPRCKSMDTKFCYFNNYNVNQPRHFCKGCQRYWTAGGALRNVPVGAGRRKAKPGPARTFPFTSADDISSLFDSGVAAVQLDQCMVDGAVFQEYWAHHQRQHLLATGGAGFHPDFPAKRRKTGPTGQTNC